MPRPVPGRSPRVPLAVAADPPLQPRIVGAESRFCLCFLSGSRLGDLVDLLETSQPGHNDTKGTKTSSALLSSSCFIGFLNHSLQLEVFGAVGLRAC